MRSLALTLLFLAACGSSKAAQKAKIEQLEEDIAKLQVWLDANTLPEQAPAKPRAEPAWVPQEPFAPDPIEPAMRETGKVLQVETGPFGMVVAISGGANEGMRAGDVCHLRRDGSYVGRLRIDRVSANQAVGRFDTVVFGSAAPPVAGDMAFAK